MLEREELIEKSHEELLRLCLSQDVRLAELMAQITTDRRETPISVTYSTLPLRRPDTACAGGYRPGLWARKYAKRAVNDGKGLPTGKLATSAGWKLLDKAGNLARAGKKLAALNKSARQPTAPAKDPVFLTGLLERFLKKRTVSAHRIIQLRGIVSLLPNRLIESYTPEDVVAAILRRVGARDTCAATRGYRYGGFSTLFRFAVKERLLVSSPCSAISPQDIKAEPTHKAPIQLSIENRRALVVAAYGKDAPLGDAIFFLAATGFRPCMLSRLTFRDVDLESSEIMVTSRLSRKSRHEKPIPVRHEVCAMLKQRADLARLHGCPDAASVAAHLVFWRTNGSAIPWKWLSVQFEALVRETGAAGKFGVTPTLYAFRKGYAQDLQRADAGAYDIMTGMAHTTPDMAPTHYLGDTSSFHRLLERLPDLRVAK